MINKFLKFRPNQAFLYIAIAIISIGSIFLVSFNRSKIAGLNKIVADLENGASVLNQRTNNLVKENASLKNEGPKQQLGSFNQVVEKYESVKAKTAEYKSKGVNINKAQSELAKVIDLIFEMEYSKADRKLTLLNDELEKLLKEKLAAAIPKPQPTNNCTKPTLGHCKITVSTNSGTFYVDVVTIDLNSATVVTDTANSSDCSNNCPAKSLLSYVNENGASHGIHGTYFCPPDYVSCNGKVNSYDFPVYNSDLKKWLNDDTLFWSNRAMMVFTSNSAVFYQQANSFSSLSGMRAAIANFPGLVSNGKNIVNNYSITSAQLTKGYRGALGSNGSSVYLIVSTSATVKDMANILIALGIQNGLNLDGGGSTALVYNKSYIYGPGRSLPNAVVFK